MKSRLFCWLSGFFSAALILIGIGCFSSDKGPNTSERIYATVDGTQLTESELQSLVPAGFYSNLTPELKKSLIQDWVSEQVLFLEARKRGIDNEPDIARILLNSKRDLLVNELLERELANLGQPIESLLREYYNNHTEDFILSDDQYLARYAFFDTMNDARDFYNEVKRGTSFSELAMTTSKDPSALDGGNLGVINEGSVEPNMWEAVVSTYTKLGAGKISNPFSVIDGFGIVIIDEKYDRGTIKTFNLVREQVIDMYLTEQRETLRNSLIDKLSAQHDVEYFF